MRLSTWKTPLWAAGALIAVSIAGSAAAADWKPLPEEPPKPEGFTMSEDKVELGKKLYFDPRLSKTGTVSCNTCHNVMEGGDDGRPSSMGVHGRVGPRNAPTVWNAAFMSTQFWDGRAATLEEQAKGPLLAHPEMGMASHDDVMERVREVPGYVAEFKAVYGGSQPVNIENAVDAIAAFERTLITPNSPYDRYVQGDKDAMTDQQVAGMKTFEEVGCTTCHSGPAFNGPQPNMAKGQGFFQKFPMYEENNPYIEEYDLMADKGRGGVTGEESDNHRYKVPTLRNVTLTAPYFHNGAVKTLPEAVRVMAKSQLNTELSDKQVEQIVAFLHALEGEFPEITLPRLPSKSGETIVRGAAPAGGGGH
jgi:cytochrome c peroxidase